MCTTLDTIDRRVPGDLATDEVFARVYDELKQLARGYLRRERPDHTLQPTALVHEAYVKMSRLEPGRWRDRRVFLAMAARAMRRILVDHARRKDVSRRWRQTVVLDAGTLAGNASAVDLIALDQALDGLARSHPEHGRIVEMHLFGGLSVAETAAVLDVSERTVYRQLRGVVLYQLLTGELPFQVDTAAPRDLVRSAESRRRELPSRHFARLDAATAARRAELRGGQRRSLERELAGDLDRIVAKALDPDPERRYASVDRFGEDLERHLDGLPVRARPATVGYRARKFVRRNRLLVAAVALVSWVDLGGTGVALWQRGLAIEAQKRAELEASRARATNDFLVSLFRTGSIYPWVDRVNKGPQTPIIDVLDEASRRLDEDLDTGDVERADLHLALATPSARSTSGTGPRRTRSGRSSCAAPPWGRTMRTRLAPGTSRPPAPPPSSRRSPGASGRRTSRNG